MVATTSAAPTPRARSPFSPTHLCLNPCLCFDQLGPRMSVYFTLHLRPHREALGLCCFLFVSPARPLTPATRWLTCFQVSIND